MTTGNKMRATRIQVLKRKIIHALSQPDIDLNKIDKWIKEMKLIKYLIGYDIDSKVTIDYSLINKRNKTN